MWIRIESFGDGTTTPQTTLNACFQTVTGPNGLVLSLGRKAGEVTFPKDKSVSRQHCQLRLVHLEAPADTGDNDENQADSEIHQKPRTDAERKACEENPFGMCWVLENSGKGGSYVIEPPPLATKTSTDTPGDGSGTDAGGSDSETDDEGISQLHASQALAHKKGAASQWSQPVSSQTKQTTTDLESISKWGDGSLVTDVIYSSTSKTFLKDRVSSAQLIKLDVGESRVLDFEGGRRLLGNTIQNEPSDERSILVQCGLNESTLRITWIPFHVTLSRMPKSLAKLPSEFYKIGATEDSSVSTSTTHLITPEVSGTAKPLTAWCRGLPMVTPKYIQALLSRKLCSDSIPPLEDHKSPFKANMDFLQTPAHPKLMKDYTVLTLEASDLEALVRFSGATVVPLYTEETKVIDAEQAVATANQTLQDVLQAGKVCLVLHSKKKLYSQLAKIEGIFPVKQNTWAKAVSQQNSTLKDANGKQIEVTSQEEQEHESKTLTSLGSTTPGKETGTSNEASFFPSTQPAEEAARGSKAVSKEVSEPISPPRPSQPVSLPSAKVPQNDELPDSSAATTASAAADKDDKNETEPSTPKRRSGCKRAATVDVSSDKEDLPSSSPRQTRRKRTAMMEESLDDSLAPSIQRRTRRKRTEMMGESPNESVISNSATQLPTSKRRRRRGEMEDVEEIVETVDSMDKIEEDDAPDFGTNVDEPNESKMDESTHGNDEEGDEKQVAQEVKSSSRPNSQSSLLSKQGRRKANAAQKMNMPDASGWFTVAPKEDAERRAIRRKAFQQQLNEDPDAPSATSFRPAASSESSALIVSPDESTGPSSSAPTDSWRSTLGVNGLDRFGRKPRNQGGTPNFKGFRKNCVPRQVDACEFFSMSLVHPKETEQQRMMDASQRELEEEQRRADELFREVGGAARGGRRRRR